MYTAIAVKGGGKSHGANTLLWDKETKTYACEDRVNFLYVPAAVVDLTPNTVLTTLETAAVHLYLDVTATSTSIAEYMKENSKDVITVVRCAAKDGDDECATGDGKFYMLTLPHDKLASIIGDRDNYLASLMSKPVQTHNASEFMHSFFHVHWFSHELHKFEKSKFVSTVETDFTKLKLSAHARYTKMKDAVKTAFHAVLKSAMDTLHTVGAKIAATTKTVIADVKAAFSGLRRDQTNILDLRRLLAVDPLADRNESGVVV